MALYYSDNLPYTHESLCHFLAFDFAVQEINNDKNLLPNTTLGYSIYDTCIFQDKAQEVTLKILSGGSKHPFNYKCNKKNTVVAFIGHLFSSVTRSVADLLSIYGYSQPLSKITYGDNIENFHDRVSYPSLFHISHGFNVYSNAIIALLKHYNWTWIGILYSSKDTSEAASQHFREESIKNGICVEFILNTPEIINTFRYTSNVIIIFSLEGYLESILNVFISPLKLREKILILSSDPYTDEYCKNNKLCVFLNRTLLFMPTKSYIPGFKEFFYNASPTVYKKSILLQRVWLQYFSCLPTADYDIDVRYLCKKNFSLRSIPNMESDAENDQATYNIYMAVHAIAHALHKMYINKSNNGRIEHYHSRQLSKYLRSLHFNTSSGKDFYFPETENANSEYSVIDEDMLSQLLASQLSLCGARHRVTVPSPESLPPTDSIAIWEHGFYKVPQSKCSETCPPGYRKSNPKQKICCYSCVLCSSGEISNQTDMDNCLECTEDEYPDTNQVFCLPRTIDYLSYHESLGVMLALFAIVLFFTTAAILGIFIMYRHTPIVRANNRFLSYVILSSLMFSFLCPMLFIGIPVKITCLLQNAVFNIIFAITLSSVLAKTITVLIAFSVVKPGSKFRIFLGSRVSIFIVLFCSFSEVGICFWWLTSWPSFPDKDSQSAVGKLILHCNVGSLLLFYVALGYNWFLALCSFIVAFLAKQLPDLFNEARYITFSMIVFCSVWVSFIPAYMSTNGKYMLAVEIFAILASSAGVLGCIFFPKCYIILSKALLKSRE
ncbi:vomeronasal type-2 receptor 26-like, partial [Pelobates cultripes]